MAKGTQTLVGRLEAGKGVEADFDLSGTREGHPCWIPLGWVTLEDKGTWPSSMYSRVLSAPEPSGSGV